MTDKKEQAEEITELVNREYMELDKQNENMRAVGMPIPSTSIEATAGASVTTFKEFQLAEVTELMKLTPKQVQARIRNYRFEIWATTAKMMTAFKHLNDVAATLSKEARAELKLSDITYNPKELSTPAKLRSNSTLTNEEKQAKDMQKVLPHLSMPEILEMIRKGRGAAFQRGLNSGAGSPTAIDTCDDCKADYVAGTAHDCPEKAARLEKAKAQSLPQSIEKPETLTEKLARLRKEGKV